MFPPLIEWYILNFTAMHTLHLCLAIPTYIQRPPAHLATMKAPYLFPEYLYRCRKLITSQCGFPHVSSFRLKLLPWALNSAPQGQRRPLLRSAEVVN
jgi:hypothetical protein